MTSTIEPAAEHVIDIHTTAGKLALKLAKDRKKVLLASLDTRRPAAISAASISSTALISRDDAS